MRFELSIALRHLTSRKIRSGLISIITFISISGVVVERKMSPGERVDQETILKVAQIDPLRVEVILPAAVFGAVETGMRAEVIPALPNAGVQVASVTIVDRVVDATSGTFGVRLELQNADHAVPSGLRCQARFLQVD